jgi:hypothetical protein
LPPSCFKSSYNESFGDGASATETESYINHVLSLDKSSKTVENLGFSKKFHKTVSYLYHHHHHYEDDGPLFFTQDHYSEITPFRIHHENS